MRDFFNVNKRHLFRFFIALSIALIINHYSFTQQWWLPLATFFVMLTKTGSAIYQGILRYVLMLLLVGGGSWLWGGVELMHLRTYDITLGAVLGVFINTLVLPDRIDISFRKSVVPVLEKLNTYFQSTVDLLLRLPGKDADKEKLMVEQALKKLPVWVFEAGFDLALQKGYRYFVMKVSEASEILFAMHHLARYSFSNELLDVISDSLVASTQKSERFFAALINGLNLKNGTNEVVDFHQEIETMQDNFKKAVPVNLLVLDVSKEYVYLIEFIYHLREFQDILIKMAEALREV
jgi:hypothetical protein